MGPRGRHPRGTTLTDRLSARSRRPPAAGLSPMAPLFRTARSANEATRFLRTIRASRPRSRLDARVYTATSPRYVSRPVPRSGRRRAQKDCLVSERHRAVGRPHANLGDQEYPDGDAKRSSGGRREREEHLESVEPLAFCEVPAHGRRSRLLAVVVVVVGGHAAPQRPVRPTASSRGRFLTRRSDVWRRGSGVDSPGGVAAVRVISAPHKTCCASAGAADVRRLLRRRRAGMAMLAAANLVRSRHTGGGATCRG